MRKSNGVLMTNREKGFRLSKVETSAPNSVDRKEVEADTVKLGERMEELFDLMYFAGQNSFLIVLQGMDAAGKDGTIRHLLRFSHAQSCRVASFKVPTPVELAHDFLWRCHAQTPGKGEITIFNRSHYEDVGIVRVHGFVPEEVWRGRYEMINDFEKSLVKSGTILLKVFLHISNAEQEERLIERENDPNAAWKLSAGDWKEREFWDAYQDAYSDAIGECSTEDAPWLVVPADKKWSRNYVVTAAIVELLEPYEKLWRDELEKVGVAAKAELAEFRAGQGS
ncbi:MAG: PPK2 family polyphosphate kinase [Fimbriimonadaceae bacterium]